MTRRCAIGWAFNGLLGIVFGMMMSLAPGASAQEWSRFRGPNGRGESEDKTIPASWTDKDYQWRITLPGVGHASPVLWGDKLFITSADPKDATQLVLCYKASDGSPLWKKEYKSSPHVLHKLNTFASSTPAADKDHVYVVWSNPESVMLAALDHSGREIWTRDFGPYISQHGFGASPMVYEDMVVLANDQGDEKGVGKSFLVAVDAKTGKDRWRIPRKTREAAYSTPCVYQPKNGPEELIFNCGVHGITSVNPKNGAVNWEIDVFKLRSVSSPMVVGGLIFGSCGHGASAGNTVVAVRPPGDGSSAPKEVYRLAKGSAAPYVPCFLAKGNLVFLWSDAGFVTCLDAPTGKVHWEKRVGGNYYGSPIRVADRLYCIDKLGTVVVLAASEKYKEIARNPLGESGNSTPAVANGTLYLRTESHLMAVGGKK